MNYDQIQLEEAKTWLIEDDKERKDKAMREWIRYPWLAKCMLLDRLDTSDMEVWDIGAGPLGGVSGILRPKRKLCIDPLTDEYRKYFACKNYWSEQAENLNEKLSQPDLVIVTNALDHFEDPDLFLDQLDEYAKYSCYFAHFHAIDNAKSHPHPAHVHNVNPELIRYHLQKNWEQVWYMDYEKDGLTYAWRKQPAFCGLYRKVTK